MLKIAVLPRQLFKWILNINSVGTCSSNKFYYYEVNTGKGLVILNIMLSK